AVDTKATSCTASRPDVEPCSTRPIVPTAPQLMDSVKEPKWGTARVSTRWPSIEKFTEPVGWPASEETVIFTSTQTLCCWRGITLIVTTVVTPPWYAAGATEAAPT